MGIDGLVRETPVRRRRIAIGLVIALATSIGLLVGTKLPRPTAPPLPTYTPYFHDEAQIERYQRARELLLQCTSLENAKLALGKFIATGPKHPDRDIELCLRLATGLPATGRWLRSLDPAEQRKMLTRLSELRGHGDGQLADGLYDALPHFMAHTAGMYNLHQGNEDRARLQLRTHVEQSGSGTGLITSLILEGLDARAAQRAGGSNR
jgi:hypothetical protein